MAFADGDAPQVIYEAGFSPETPALSPGDLILGDVSAGKLDTGKLGGSTVWTDISAWVLSAEITRASTREQGPVIVYEGGTATLQLRNDDARFSPENLLGPYVSGGVSLVRPVIPVRVRAIWNGTGYPLFSGFAQAWTPGSENLGPSYDETTLTCADGFLVLEGVTLPAAAPAGAGELSGARVSRILTAAGWYDAARGMSAISAGESAVQATAFGASALSLLQLTAASEIGDLYCDAAGAVTFRGRQDVLTDPRSNAVQAIFGDRPGTMHGSTATSIANNFEGGADATVITAGNSGGISGQPFTAVTTAGGGTVTFDAAQAAHGTLSAKCVTTASTSAANMSYAITGAPAQLWARFCLYVPALPAANDYALQFTDAGGARLAAIGVSISGGPGLYNAAGAGGFATFLTALPTGQWVRFEVTVTFPQDSTATITAQLYTTPDSTTATETLARTGQNFGSTPVANVLFGPSKSVASNFTAYLDDLDVNTTGFPGPAFLLPELYYSAAARPAADLSVANDVQATIDGSSSVQQVTDTASVALLLFRRSYERSDLILTTDAEALQWAGYVAYITGGGQPEFDTITTIPAYDPASLWPQALGREIGDRIQAWRRQPGMTVPISQDSLIRGISHTITAGEWTTGWLLQNAVRYSFLTLDETILGKLDNNAVAF